MNYKYLGLVSSLLLWLFTSYLNYRQYQVILRHERTLLSSYPANLLKRHCSLSIHLKNHQNYPNCPVSIKNHILSMNSQKSYMKFAICNQSVRTLTLIGLVISPALPWFHQHYMIPSNYFWHELLGAQLFFGGSVGLTRVLFEVFEAKCITPYYRYTDTESLLKLLYTSLKSVFWDLLWDYGMYLVAFFLLISLPWYVFLPISFFLIFGYQQYLCIEELSLFEMQPLRKTALSEPLLPLIQLVGFPPNRVGIVERILTDDEAYQMSASMMGSFSSYFMVITEGIIKLMSIPELQGIVGHELGHWYGMHSNHDAFAQAAALSLLYYLFVLGHSNQAILADFGVTLKNSYNVIFLFLWSFLTDLLVFLLEAIKSALFQYEELCADKFATYLGFGVPLKSALDKLALYHAAATTPLDPLVRLIYHTHPAVATRKSHIDSHLVTMASKKFPPPFPFKPLPVYTKPLPLQTKKVALHLP
jgi:Zn-dependent protease with chaperone function